MALSYLAYLCQACCQEEFQKCENLGVVQPFEGHNLILKGKIRKRKHPPEDG
jgi:hypothetical protein